MCGAQCGAHCLSCLSSPTFSRSVSAFDTLSFPFTDTDIELIVELAEDAIDNPSSLLRPRLRIALRRLAKSENDSLF
jgi:hypothetical protein